MFPFLYACLHQHTGIEVKNKKHRGPMESRSTFRFHKFLPCWNVKDTHLTLCSILWKKSINQSTSLQVIDEQILYYKNILFCLFSKNETYGTR
jgi:hypothetical protein